MIEILTHPMFMVALFTIAKLRNQPRCPPTNAWIKKMCYIHTMEYYSATKKNEIMSFAGKWLELEIIALSKISQTQKDKYNVFCQMGNLDIKNDMNLKGRLFGGGANRREKDKRRE
jgi:hypothetical protein